MGDAVKHCLANLTNFDGRDARSTFWWWVLAIVIVSVIVSFASSMVFTASSMAGAFQSVSAGGDPDQIEVEIMQSMAGSLGIQTWISAGISILGMAAIAATFTRRLRDAGLPPVLVVIPIIATLVSVYFSITMVDEMAEVMASGDLEAMNAMTASTAVWSLIGWIGYLVIIIGGLLPTKD